MATTDTKTTDMDMKTAIMDMAVIMDTAATITEDAIPDTSSISRVGLPVMDRIMAITEATTTMAGTLPADVVITTTDRPSGVITTITTRL